MANSKENSNRTETEVFPYDLDLRGFPDGIVQFILEKYRRVKGNLYIDRGFDLKLPEGLFIEGNLELFGSSIQALPRGLTVCGNLYLSRTLFVRTLPEDLSVGGNLDILDSQLDGQKLPETISVGGCVIDSNYLYNL
ncbi:hypothetical protein IJ102_00605 [Candidatus Saccharibacteria bacterium]|nr:hypothetical protein [Candidatus Saccharibacteria bacterium]